MIPQIRALADSGDRRSRAMAAWTMLAQSQFAEAAPYVRSASADGAPYLAGWLVQHLAGQPDPALRGLIPEFLRLAARTSTIDPFGPAMNAATAGDGQGMQDILDAAFDTPPWLNELDGIVHAGRQHLITVEQTAAAVAARRDETVTAFETLLATANGELAALQEVAQQAGVLASDTSAEVQAKEYGERAAVSEKRAGRFTTASISLAIAIALASLLLAVLSVSNSDKVGEGLQKAAFAIPFLVLNGYLIGLAREARREALRWRHVQLQLKAATPFLGVLDEERRKDVTALLALRFFPGQPLPDGADSGDAAAADASALAALFTEKPAAPNPPAERPGA